RWAEGQRPWSATSPERELGGDLERGPMKLRGARSGSSRLCARSSVALEGGCGSWFADRVQGEGKLDASRGLLARQSVGRDSDGKIGSHNRSQGRLQTKDTTEIVRSTPTRCATAHACGIARVCARPPTSPARGDRPRTPGTGLRAG